MKKLKKAEESKIMKQKGITLIALVITIIVLLILASVGIAMLTGENGILNKTSKAKEEQEEANARERLQVELMAIKTEVLSKNEEVGLDKLDAKKDELAKKNIIVAENGVPREVILDEYIFRVKEDLTIDGYGESAAKTSNVINDFEIELEAVGNDWITIKATTQPTTKDDSNIDGYIVYLNNEKIGETPIPKYTIQSLERETSYTGIFILAIDENGKTKKSTNELTVTTTNVEIEPLEYPLVTVDGIKNAKIKDTNEYILDLSIDCTADNALDKKAYDGNPDTCSNVASGKIYFDLGGNIDVFKLCFNFGKLEGNPGLWKPSCISGTVWVSDCTVTDEVVYRYTGSGHYTGWSNNRAWIFADLYEIYYDDSLT